MLKTLFLKLKKFVIQNIARLLPIKQDCIFFESFPELDGSPRMIYNELKKRGYEKKYKFIWLVNKDYDSHDIQSMPCFGHLTIKEKILKEIRLCHAKIIIDSNRPIAKRNPKTFRLYTRHGGPLKRVQSYTKKLGEVDFVLATSEETRSLDFIDYQNSSCKSINQVVPLGFPANDELFNKDDLKSTDFFKRHLDDDSSSFDKIIGWLPTIRQHKVGKRVDSTKIYPFGMPLVYSKKDLDRLNCFLNQKNILLAVQLHHAQAANFSRERFSNIVLISEEIKREMNISFASLLKSFDALITDYSSVYYEYLLLNRPIALSIDDIEEYTTKTELYVDYFDWIKGDYLKNIDDLITFVKNVSLGIDSKKQEREYVLHRVHAHVDDQSTKRVVDFLINNTAL